MLYVTIIVVAILIVGCIIVCNYLNHRYDSNLYDNDYQYAKLQDCKVIVEDIIVRLNDYNNAEEKDKYKFHVSDKEIYNTFENIRRIVGGSTISDD